VTGFEAEVAVAASVLGWVDCGSLPEFDRGGHVLEHQQVDRQGAQVRPVDHRRARLRRCGRRRHYPAGTAAFV